MAASLRASEEGLKKIDQARRNKGWTKTEQAWYQLALSSKATLKRFLDGKPVKQETFVSLCNAVGIENWEEIRDHTLNQPTVLSKVPTISCSAYNEETWVGREELIRQLSQKLKGQCRVLIITGITGLGKTALGERLATVELPEDYPNYKVVNFDEGAGTQDFVSTAENLLNQLGEKVTADERKNPNGLLNRLVQKLRSRPYLVQMDSLEVLLKGQGDDDTARNEFQDELWSAFFNGLLAGQDCQSRLILTSQDLPTQFGSRYEKFWAEESLRGLNETEQFELFQKLFQRQEKEIEPESEAVGYLKRMSKAYEGHPLVIEVIAGEILAVPFNGNVVAYWQRYRQEFEAIEPVIGHQQLQLKVKDRVRKSLKRLAHDVPNAYTLLCRSSVYRRSVPESFCLAMLGNLTEDEKAAARGTLQFRYLLVAEGVTSAGQCLLRQHNLIRSVAYQLLDKQSSEWRNAHNTAATMWQTAYEPEPDAPNLEKVRGYLEAFHHLSQLEDWKGASEILFIRLDTPMKEELHNLLGLWCYYPEQMELYNKLLGKLARKGEAFCLGNLGNAYNFLEDYHQALEYHQKNLAIVRELGEHSLEGRTLNNLGITYNGLGEYHKAIESLEQCLAIVRERSDPSIEDIEGRALNNLGIAYNALGEYHKAIESLEQCLVIVRERSDREAEGRALGNLGNAYYFLEEYDQVIEYYQPHLVIARSIDDRAGEGTTLCNLAKLHQKLGHRDLAVRYCNQALAIATELYIPLAKECQELKEKLLSENT
jgi:tetratricopeptide (TPR) repeat protein